MPKRFEEWDKDLTLIKAANRELSIAELNLRHRGIRGAAARAFLGGNRICSGHHETSGTAEVWNDRRSERLIRWATVAAIIPRLWDTVGPAR